MAGSLSIQPFEVSRNGIVQLWVLKGDETGREGARWDADGHNQLEGDGEIHERSGPSGRTPVGAQPLGTLRAAPTRTTNDES
jgi:hypothetical protein